MTFENHTRGEMHEQRKSENDAKIVEKEEAKAAASADPAKGEESLAKKTGHPEETVGLIGGQPIGDPRGLDISHYTGPKTQPSSQFDDPEAPYHQGPGSGLNQKEEAEGEWENPEPENDTF